MTTEVEKVQAATDVDYRDLLRRYISHVGDWEGIDYLGWRADPAVAEAQGVENVFTADEFAVLTELSNDPAPDQFRRPEGPDSADA